MLKRIIKSVSVIVTILCLVMAFIPVQAFAVDPLSTAMIGNAFAQAIAAYGASQGAAMTFDVNSSNGIGEGVHDLWKQFRATTNTPDDFDSVASVYIQSDPYRPESINIAGATLQVLGINISESLKPTLDDFWDWLLTGPAEMTKVDNQYFEFSSAQVGSESTPIILVRADSYPFLSMPTGNYSDAQSLVSTGMHLGNNSAGNSLMSGVKANSGATVYPFAYLNSSNKWKQAAFSVSSFDYYRASYYTGSNSYSAVSSASSSSITYNGFTYYEAVFSNELTSSYIWEIPTFSSYADARDAWLTWIGAPTYNTTIGVQAYDDIGVAEFPDTADPNYDAVHPPIPLDIPWDDLMYGDGTDTLTDTQIREIIQDLIDELIEDGVVELADEGNPPAPDPGAGEVYIPFLPITLPSFNFNLSGIWHYVREWVSSLGAWFTTLFSIWNALPYAMVVPVYATAVVVIVLGVYKRFFM